MKKKVFLMFVTIILTGYSTTYAQIKFGVHAGLNLETQAKLGQLWNNSDPYQGFILGTFSEYRKQGSHFAVQLELNYQKKGLKTTETSDGVSIISRREFNYLSVPLLARYYVHDAGLGDKLDVVFLAGPYAGFLTSVNSKVKAGGISTSVDIDDQARKTDAGAILGFGVTHTLQSGKVITTEFRYGLGIKGVDKSDDELTNKEFGIILGMSF